MAGGASVNNRCKLYRHFAADDTLLYVGISLTILQRTISHRGGAAWYDQIVKITIETYDTREAAFTAETLAIQNERPLYNIDKTPRRRFGVRKCPDHLKNITYGRQDLAGILGCTCETMLRWSKQWANFPQPMQGVWPDRWDKTKVDDYLSSIHFPGFTQS